MLARRRCQRRIKIAPVVSLVFPPLHMLGFDSNDDRELRADKLLHMTAAINNVYVYCDMVGKIKSLLLCIVHTTNDVKQQNSKNQKVCMQILSTEPNFYIYH